jgi:indolepyruvate ferredoxin oxidoreductase alpha subunit
MPALMELRIRACHVRGSFTARDNRAPAISTRALMNEPAAFDYARLAHPPVTFRHEKLKYEDASPLRAATSLSMASTSCCPVNTTTWA